MREIEYIKPDVAETQWGAKAGRLALLASMLLGFAFVTPKTLTAQTPALSQHKSLTTRQAFEYAGKHYAGPAVEVWAAEADDDDLETALDAAQLLDAVRLATYLDDEFGVRLPRDTAPRLVVELRYFNRFSVMPARPLRASSPTERSRQTHFRGALSATGP